LIDCRAASVAAVVAGASKADERSAMRR